MNDELGRHRKLAALFALVVVVLLATVYRAEILDGDATLSIEPNALVNATSSDTQATGHDKISLIRQSIIQQRHWELQMYDRGERVDCKIHTAPISLSQLPSVAPMHSVDKEQYVIHIHGLHHTGTGFLRQTLHDALNDEYSSPVASMMDSLRPYQHLLDEARGNAPRMKALRRQYKVPENEGQHLQSVYPVVVDRVKEMRASEMGIENVAKYTYMADLCTVEDDGDASPMDIDDRRRSNHQRIGNILHNEWSRYWDPSATFLLQKTPSLDVRFLESTKVLPTLHVILVRHPLTSNSVGNIHMGKIWLDAYTHVFDLLVRDEIEWYAVVTYEALVQHRDIVVKELLEVIRSGMGRYGDRQKQSLGTRSRATRQLARQHRRLPYHKGRGSSESSSISYLMPKEKSVELWKECLSKRNCRDVILGLTKEVLPHFGYVSVRPDNTGLSGAHAIMPLRPRPGPVVVEKQFGRVLFTSEGAALSRLRGSRDGTAGRLEGDYKPSLVLSAMKDMLQ